MRISRVVTSLPDAPYLMGESLYREPRSAWSTLGISVVMPCLNEEDSVAVTVGEAFEGIRRTGLTGEVIVVDNGSTDGSALAARRAGARVIHEPARGYGNACRRGLREARGQTVVLGDSDGTYDFRELDVLVGLVESGADVAMGSRLRGQIQPGAMPWLHRWIGNPFLTWVLNRLFSPRVSDAHCGLRAVSRDRVSAMSLKATGMEFASEFLIVARIGEARIVETPIAYRVRTGGKPKLRTFRDGWRHLSLIFGLWARQFVIGDRGTAGSDFVESGRLDADRSRI